LRETYRKVAYVWEGISKVLVRGGVLLRTREKGFREEKNR